ncbi:C39 family peptidase [Aerococcaceae bacterium WGS1372]
MPKMRNLTSIATIASLIFIALCLSLVILLSKLTADNNLVIADYEQNINQVDSSESMTVEYTTGESTINSSQVVTEEVPAEIPQTLESALSEYEATDPQIQASIANMVQDEFGSDLIDSQGDILSAIQSNNLDVEELGYLFLPEHPAKLTASSATNQIDVPLYLQKDAKWRTTKYGSNTTQQLGENGCAILSLAMVHATYEGRGVDPEEILNWSKENYWVDNAGTSWQIFYDFALEFGYDFYNYGNGFYSAMNAVNDGELVIASVKPGYFTSVGHIIVIRGYDYDTGMVYVNDPNDDAEKMYSIQGIDESILLAEGVNYWSLSK